MARPCCSLHQLRPPGACHWCTKWHGDAGYRALWGPEPCAAGYPPTPPPTAAGGPGTELKTVLAEAGFEAGNCSCNSRAAEMDRWGPAGCREHREEIVGWLREEYEKLGWLARLGAGLRALTGGLVFDVLDPVGGLVDEAIRRAEGKAGSPQPPAA